MQGDATTTITENKMSKEDVWCVGCEKQSPVLPIHSQEKEDAIIVMTTSGLQKNTDSCVYVIKMVLHAIRHRPRRNRELLDKVQYEEVVPIFLQTE